MKQRRCPKCNRVLVPVMWGLVDGQRLLLYPKAVPVRGHGSGASAGRNFSEERWHCPKKARTRTIASNNAVGNVMSRPQAQPPSHMSGRLFY